MLCEKLSARTVEIGLVPLGAFGMTAFLLALYFARTRRGAGDGLDVAGFLRPAGRVADRDRPDRASACSPASSSCRCSR